MMFFDSLSDVTGADVGLDTLAVYAARLHFTVAVVLLADGHRARVLEKRCSADSSAIKQEADN